MLAQQGLLQQVGRMKQLALTLLVSVSVIAQCNPSFSKDRKITGTIRGFECGDNCYLTIVDRKKAEQVGLCAAPECESWNEQTVMPSRYKGKRVTVTVGQGQQVDDSGNVMGEMMAFKKIIFLD
ncbi:hypothetical protein [Mesorhizobium qingshengii]|uniref:Uncharacterized protein n=1 Tax=Mesorhizobium qingshengii TaxID=1165689 RepID=A0A1G5Y554_9HYPH|nr:hypothetical protein [Mesorhizobium qingshengii]SDA77560.1 hypothetical protein SAMN02927914_02897 [Mesorhizobium qingshengii]